MELLKNAWNGWLAFMGAGKLSGLFLLCLLLCFFLELGKCDQRKKELFGYCSIMAVVLILPISAVILMIYQTRFYDYEWIWTTVPLTGLIACGEVLFWSWFQRREKRKERRWLMAAALLALNLLCGSLGNPDQQVKSLAQERVRASAVLTELAKEEKDDILLWAPKEVVSHARSLDGDIALLYGRNLYEDHLNAYSYDGYSEEMWELYIWMVMAGRYGTVVVPVEGDMARPVDGLRIGDELDGRKCMEKALSLGVNRVLLPGNMSPEEVEALAEDFTLAWERMEDYYLLASN